MAFVLATRLQLVIDSIINHDQTASIKTRYMGYNIRLIDGVVDYFDRCQKKGVLFIFRRFSEGFRQLRYIGDLCLKRYTFSNLGLHLNAE